MAAKAIQNVDTRENQIKEKLFFILNIFHFKLLNNVQ